MLPGQTRATTNVGGLRPLRPKETLEQHICWWIASAESDWVPLGSQLVWLVFRARAQGLPMPSIASHWKCVMGLPRVEICCVPLHICHEASTC